MANSQLSTLNFPPHRVVLLGASNLTRSFPLVVDLARSCWGTPLDVLSAHGHGRSYGIRSQVLFRSLPGILESGLWSALAERPPAETAALITDLGNDVLYDVPIPQIAAWVDECIRRLQGFGARVVLTGLPLASLRRLTPARFRFFRRITYPRSNLSYEDALRLAEELQSHACDLARRYQLPLIEPEAAWYGLDPIHVRWRACPVVWKEILGRWSSPPIATSSRRLPRTRQFQLRLLRPEVWRLFGKELHHLQPAAVWPDGTTVSLF